MTTTPAASKPRRMAKSFGAVMDALFNGAEHHARLSPCFGSLRLSKADSFTSPVIVDEINSGDFESSSDSRFIREGNWDLPVNNLSSTDGCHADL
jgi:hypothetical protein